MAAEPNAAGMASRVVDAVAKAARKASRVADVVAKVAPKASAVVDVAAKVVPKRKDLPVRKVRLKACRAVEGAARSQVPIRNSAAVVAATKNAVPAAKLVPVAVEI